MAEIRSEATALEPTIMDTEPVGSVTLTDETVDDIPVMVDASNTGGAEPVAAAERYFSVDLLRGFALMGILAMNIVGFGWPGPVYGNPFRGAGFDGLNRVLWYLNHLVFEEKMMTLFSMLFGAGLVLMDQRAEARGASIRGVYYRRILWLLVIGLIHSYLIWEGDVLVLYAECGLFLYFFRNMNPRTLITLGLALTLLLVPLVFGLAATIDYMKKAPAKVEAKTKAGEKPTALEAFAAKQWTETFQKKLLPDPAQKMKKWDESMATHRSGYVAIVKDRAFEQLVGQTLGFILGGAFFAGGRMLLGMGLMKLGVFSAQRSRRFYLGMMLLGYGIGLPLMIHDAHELISHRFSFDYAVHGGAIHNLLGSVVVALGHVGFWMLIVQAGVLTWLTRRIAAVGRMALTSYLTHSIVCTTIFYGYGLGYYGTLDRTRMAAIVVTIWILQLGLSPIWLKHFRFGPAEWLWRSLTYWRSQPMRLSQEPSLAA